MGYFYYLEDVALKMLIHHVKKKNFIRRYYVNELEN